MLEPHHQQIKTFVGNLVSLTEKDLGLNPPTTTLLSLHPLKITHYKRDIVSLEAHPHPWEET
jgi:hypothetical protein